MNPLERELIIVKVWDFSMTEAINHCLVITVPTVWFMLVLPRIEAYCCVTTCTAFLCLIWILHDVIFKLLRSLHIYMCAASLRPSLSLCVCLAVLACVAMLVLSPRPQTFFCHSFFLQCLPNRFICHCQIKGGTPLWSCWPGLVMLPPHTLRYTD
jgi:hypothetical protein